MKITIRRLRRIGNTSQQRGTRDTLRDLKDYLKDYTETIKVLAYS